MEKFKTIKEKKELYIDFTEEEMSDLGWKENQRLSIDVKDDGCIEIKPWKTIELDTESWDPSIYRMLVTLSLEQDKSVNDVIVDIITTSINRETATTNTQLICENGTI